MTESLQNKLNEFRRLATTPVDKNRARVIDSNREKDSLSKAIRNPEEAEEFMIQLNALIVLSQKK